MLQPSNSTPNSSPPSRASVSERRILASNCEESCFSNSIQFSKEVTQVNLLDHLVKDIIKHILFSEEGFCVNEFGSLVKKVKEIESENQKLKSQLSEVKNKVIARKSIVAATNIKKGTVLTEDNLTVKRPGSGISPMQWDNVLGQKAVRNFKADELIEL